jgi:hypothetical protein
MRSAKTAKKRLNFHYRRFVQRFSVLRHHNNQPIALEGACLGGLALPLSPLFQKLMSGGMHNFRHDPVDVALDGLFKRAFGARRWFAAHFRIRLPQQLAAQAILGRPF